MAPSRSRSLARACVALALGTAVLALLARAYAAGFVDDTYIFLRYAQNIADGCGAVFNPGERVEGYSSPLWTFLLAGAARVADIEIAAAWLGLLMGAGCALAVDRALCRARADGGIRIVAAATTLTLPDMVFWSASGMDAALFTLLATASVQSAARDHASAAPSRATIALIVLCVFTRAEGLIVAAFVFGHRVLRHRQVRGALPVAAAVAALLAARSAYYDEWLPNTFHAKVNGDTLRRLSRGLAYLFDGAIAHWPLVLAGIVAAGARLRGVGARRAYGASDASNWVGIPRDRSPQAISINHLHGYIGSWVAVWCAYVVYVGGDNFGMHRFLLPVAPMAILFLFSCLAPASVTVTPTPLPSRERESWDKPVANHGDAAHGMRRSPLVAAVSLIGFVSISHVVTYRHSAGNQIGDIALVAPWRHTGLWLRENTPEDAVIATCVPGAMGFFSQRTSIDMLGLTDRTVAAEGEVHPGAAHAHGRFHTDYIFRREPDFVIYHSSGRYTAPQHRDPESINRLWGHALYDFVTDPRCAERYAYAVEPLPDGTVVEMQRRVR